MRGLVSTVDEDVRGQELPLVPHVQGLPFGGDQTEPRDQQTQLDHNVFAKSMNSVIASLADQIVMDLKRKETNKKIT